jgi:DNA-binding MarR family transcriptional regulator
MVTNGNLTGRVERLGQESLVSRATSPTDGRVQMVRLTEAGKRAFDAIAPEHRRWIANLFAGLSAEESAQLHTLLGKLRSSIRQSLGEERAP